MNIILLEFALHLVTVHTTGYLNLVTDADLVQASQYEFKYSTSILPELPDSCFSLGVHFEESAVVMYVISIIK